LAVAAVAEEGVAVASTKALPRTRKITETRRTEITVEEAMVVPTRYQWLLRSPTAADAARLHSPLQSRKLELQHIGVVKEDNREAKSVLSNLSTSLDSSLPSPPLVAAASARSGSVRYRGVVTLIDTSGLNA
jgi:hypothetical protein